MTTLKQEKKDQLQQQLENYKKILARVQELKTALSSYDKNIINKTFFEKYFTFKDINGELSKDWKGNLNTSFQFSGKAYNFDRYEKRIFLAFSEYVEVNATDKTTVIKAVEEKESNILNWIKTTEERLAENDTIDEETIKAEIIAIFYKYNKPSLWGKILEDYEVKYPSEY